MFVACAVWSCCSELFYSDSLCLSSGGNTPVLVSMSSVLALTVGFMESVHVSSVHCCMLCEFIV